MRPNIAFDSVAEIGERIRSNPMPVVDMTREVVVVAASSNTVFVNGRRCSGKNQKIVGRFFNTVIEIGFEQEVEGMTYAKRPGLDMAIASLGLQAFMRARQREGKVYLQRIGR